MSHRDHVQVARYRDPARFNEKKRTVRTCTDCCTPELVLGTLFRDGGKFFHLACHHIVSA